MDTQKKVLGKLKLNQLSKNELEKREMKVLKGGCGCHDSCDDGSKEAEKSSSSVMTEHPY